MIGVQGASVGEKCPEFVQAEKLSFPIGIVRGETGGRLLVKDVPA